MRGGAFFNGKEGRDDFRTNLFARGGQGSRKICVICPNRSHLRIRIKGKNLCSSVKSVGQDTPPDVLKTRNPLAISDISLIFALCKQ